MTKPNGKKTGRPRKDLTDEQIEQVEKLAPLLTQAQIADFLGIAERTVRLRMYDDPRVFAAYHRGRARAIGNVAKNLVQKAMEGDMRAAEFYLRTQGQWSDRVINEHVGEGGGPLEVQVTRRIVQAPASNRIQRAAANGNGANGHARH
jgi:hypothetical protein